MGNFPPNITCSNSGEPDYSNICNNNIGDSYSVPNACVSINIPPIPGVVPFCNNIGADEWEFDSGGGFCGISLADIPIGGITSFPRICIGTPSAPGYELNCKRKSFNGEVLPCCLLDLQCYPQQSNRCWDDSTRNKTCKPENRNINNSACSDTITNYCTGADLSDIDKSWIKRWTDPIIVNGYVIDKPCVYALNRNLYNSSTLPLRCDNFDLPNLPISSDGFIFGQNLITVAYNKYVNSGFTLGVNPGSKGYSKFQDVLFEICKKNPGICNNALTNAGSNLTLDRLTLNPVAAKFFGCYLPDSEYTKYTDRYGLSRECTPSCNKSDVIPLTDTSGVNKLICNNTACIIDDINIALLNSDIAGNVSFSQVCGTCAGDGINSFGNCTCIIENNTIAVANSKIGGNISLNQQCGGTTCVNVDTNTGQKTQTPCTGPGSVNPLNDSNATKAAAVSDSTNKSVLGFIFLVFLLILLLLITYVVIKKYKNKN
jgi:hypothetical protein